MQLHMGKLSLYVVVLFSIRLSLRDSLSVEQFSLLHACPYIFTHIYVILGEKLSNSTKAKFGACRNYILINPHLSHLTCLPSIFLEPPIDNNNLCCLRCLTWIIVLYDIIVT